MSVARVPLGYHQRVEVLRRVTIADERGNAEWELEDSPSPKSIWIAVDLRNGELAVAAPPDGVLRETPLTSSAFGSGPANEVDSVRYPGHVVAEALVARTALSKEAAGAWGLRLTDGGSADADSAHNGALTLAVGSMAAIEGELAPPEHFVPGDVVVLVDPDRMEVSAVRLEEGTGPGGER